jgi:predicted nucleotidyltransferase/uncharacterized protein (UPF0332 family)
MEFKIKKKENPHIRKYTKEDYEIATKFAKRIYKEFGSLLKAVVLFGSAARKTESGKGDIDVLVVINDLTVVLTGEMVEAYRVITEKAVNETSNRLHITTLKLTHFWEYIRKGDPIGINILRDGVALIDTGFFDPLQALLFQGRIRPTWESIWTYFTRAPNTLLNSQWHIMQATLDMYWAVVDAAHAALMKLGEIPPSPAHVADMLDEKMVKQKLLAKKYTDIMRNFYDISKRILHREVKEISGREYDEYYRDAKEFVDVMRKFIEKKG